MNWYFECRGCFLLTHWHLPPWLLSGHTVPRDCVFICFAWFSSLESERMDDWVPSSLLGSQYPLDLCFDHNLSWIICQLRGSVEMRIHPLLHWKEKALWILAGFSNWKIHISLSQLDCVGICLYTGSQVKCEPGMWSEFWWEGALLF